MSGLSYASVVAIIVGQPLLCYMVARVELAKLDLCSSGVMCVVRFLCLIQDLHSRRVCQWVNHLLGQEMVDMALRGAGVKYVLDMLRWKHRKQHRLQDLRRTVP
jgi:hypothetical protein